MLNAITFKINPNKNTSFFPMQNNLAH